MNHRRVIGSLLTFALLTGQTFVPMARAACAVPKPKASACPVCFGAPSSEAAAISTDRSCCAAPLSITDREPASLSAERARDPRVLVVAEVLPAARVCIAVPPSHAPPLEPGRPGASPPNLRTTILLI